MLGAIVKHEVYFVVLTKPSLKAYTLHCMRSLQSTLPMMPTHGVAHIEIAWVVSSRELPCKLGTASMIGERQIACWVWMPDLKAVLAVEPEASVSWRMLVRACALAATPV